MKMLELPADVAPYLQNGGDNKGCLVIPGKNVFPCIYLSFRSRSGSADVLIANSIRTSGLPDEYGMFEMSDTHVRCWGLKNFYAATEAVLLNMASIANQAGIAVTIMPRTPKMRHNGSCGNAQITVDIALRTTRKYDQFVGNTPAQVLSECRWMANLASEQAAIVSVNGYMESRITASQGPDNKKFKVYVPLWDGVDMRLVLEGSGLRYRFLEYKLGCAVIFTSENTVKIQETLLRMIPGYGGSCYVPVEDYVAYVESGRPMNPGN